MMTHGRRDTVFPDPRLQVAAHDGRATHQASARAAQKTAAPLPQPVGHGIAKQAEEAVTLHPWANRTGPPITEATLGPWPFGDLQMFGYDVIVCDPPWDFKNYSIKGTKKGADPHYEVMSREAIKSLPVGHLAKPDCLLLLWATGCMLPHALETMEAWCFTYKSEIVWRKTTINGKVRMGTGYRVRTMHEPILVGTIGNPKHPPFPSIFDGLAREHSRKPSHFYEIIERHTLGYMRADLFSRQDRQGWDAWGAEVGKFTDDDIARFATPEVR